MSPSCAAAICVLMVTDISRPCPSAGTRNTADTRPSARNEPRSGSLNSSSAVSTHTSIDTIASRKYGRVLPIRIWPRVSGVAYSASSVPRSRSEEHTSELQSRSDLVCRLLLEKKKKKSCTATLHTRQELAYLPFAVLHYASPHTLLAALPHYLDLDYLRSSVTEPRRHPRVSD